jgi:hypothetical protein
MAMTKKIACYSCKNSWEYEPPLSRRAECPNCRRDAKCCRNCRFFDRGSHHECREEQAEWVKDKEQGNFCGFFEPNQAAAGVDPNAGTLSKLDNLFGGGGASESSSTGKSGNLSDELQKFLDSKK